VRTIRQLETSGFIGVPWRSTASGLSTGLIRTGFSLGSETASGLPRARPRAVSRSGAGPAGGRSASWVDRREKAGLTGPGGEVHQAPSAAAAGRLGAGGRLRGARIPLLAAPPHAAIVAVTATHPIIE